MAGQVVTHVLLDFFGTLVRYSPSRTEQGYHASHALAASMGARMDYQGFLQAWAAESALFDERSAVGDSEFSMEEVGAAFLSRILRRDRTPPRSPRSSMNTSENGTPPWSTCRASPD
jgi:putative hydrolase of the HAD superfamily